MLGVLGATSLVAISARPVTPGATGTSRVAVAAEEPVLSPAQVRDRAFSSRALNRDMRYLVYLPRGYETSTTRYPVLYMLHGLGDDYRQWERLGLLDTASDLISRGAIPPMIIVLPQGDRGYWVDHVDDGPQYGTYVSRDLVSHIDAQYRTRAERGARAIGGLSMGAHGALDLALTNPEEFGVAGGHSLALRRMENALEFFGTPENWTAHDPPSLMKARSAAPGAARPMAMWIDIGDDDPWAAPNAKFHTQLTADGVPHQWRARPGKHDHAYWASHVEEYLRFYGNALAEDLAPRG